MALALTALALLLSQQAPVTLTQGTGRAALPNIVGLGQAEQGEGGPFRWSTGPVAIGLQPLGYPLFVKLHVQGVRPEGEPQARMWVSSGGKNLGLFDLPRSPTEVEVKLPATELFSINPRLDITTTLFQPPGDNRTLGTVFYQVEQRSGPGPALPSLWPSIWLLLSDLLLFQAVYSVWRRTNYALTLAVMWGIIIGLLNLFARPALVFFSLYTVVPPLTALLVLPWVRSLLFRRTSQAHADAGIASPEPAITERPWPLALAVTAISLAVTAWHLLAPTVAEGSAPTDNLAWGVSFYGALPVPLQILGIGAILAAILWAALSPMGKAEQKAQMAQAGSQFALSTSLTAFAGLLVFSLFPVAHSEGDTAEFDRKIPIGAIWRERELLDFYLKARLWALLRPWLPRPSQVYVLTASLAGALYTWGALLLGKTLGRTGADKWIIAGALMATGNLLLFFGYIESYALVNVLGLFVIWACWQYTRGAVLFGTVGALATLAPLFHGSALWWGPMVVTAWLLRARSLPARTRWKTAFAEGREGVAVGAAMMLVVFSVMALEGYDYERFQAGLGELGGIDGRTLLPLFTAVSPYERYVYFSWSHLGAVVQEQLLTAPMALPTIIVLLLGAWRGIKRLAGVMPSLIVLGVGAAGTFYYTTAWNPDLGPRSDWDLLALSSPALSLVAVYLLLHLHGRPRRLSLAAYLSVSAVHTAAWVVLHIAGRGY